MVKEAAEQQTRVELDDINYKVLSEDEVYQALTSNSKLEKLTNQHFKHILRQQQIVQKVAFNIYEKVQSVCQQANMAQVQDVISMCDKDIFVQFRDCVITYNQLQARILERRGSTKVTVFDDLKADLDPSIKTMLVEKPGTFKLILKRKKNIEDLLKPREPWEQNEHCLKSICYKLKKPSVRKHIHVQTQRSQKVLSHTQNSYKTQS